MEGTEFGVVDGVTITGDREAVVVFLHRFLNETEEWVDDENSGEKEITQLVQMALVEWAGSGPITHYAVVIYKMARAFVGEFYPEAKEEDGA